jgi:transposase
MKTAQLLRSDFRILKPHLNEKSRRLWAALEAKNAGRGGVTLLHEVTGLSRATITRGIDQIKTGRGISRNNSRQRRSGSGRKLLVETDENLIIDLKKILESNTRGDPMRPLLWTDKSTRTLATELKEQGHDVSHATVAALLEQLGYSLQSNLKSKERKSHPDRNAQFEFINTEVKDFQKRGLPVISVDAKKKELIGDFKNSGQTWRESGDPVKVQVHDFEYKELGKGIPYGVYDMNSNKGWVSVGTDHDTAEFAVETIKRWWKKMGSIDYPNVTELLITADGGGSNGSSPKLWKSELSKFSKESGLKITVSHLPPGTSKWNKIEHRMFSQITRNWKGRPLLSHQVMVNLIANTTTSTGLKIRSELDNGVYDVGIEVSKEEMDNINLSRNDFHGDWNYIISP